MSHIRHRGPGSVRSRAHREHRTPRKSAHSHRGKLEYVEFVTRDDTLFKVSSDHYHSFTRKFDTHTAFKNEDVDSHMLSLDYLNKMPSTLIDEHCVRQINDTYSHCILCNHMVKNSNVTKHHLTIGHGQREKEAITDQSTTSKIDNTSNMDVASSVSNSVIKMKAQAVTATPITSNIDKAVNINVARFANLAKATGKVASVNGDINLDKAKGTVKAASVNGDVNLAIAEAKVKAASVNGDVKLKAPEKANNETKTSIAWQVIYPYELTTQYGNTVRCVICDRQVLNNPEKRKGHLVDLKHAKNLEKKRVTYENTFEATEDRYAVLCVICGTRVVNSPYHLRAHLNGVIHACHVENIRKEKRKEAERKLKRKAALLSGKATQSSQEPKTYESASDTIRKNKWTNCYLSWV